MKTFKQLQENIGKALAKFGVKGLRKITSQVTKKGNTKKILDATSRRMKMDQLITKNQKRLLNIRQKATTSFDNPNMVKYKKTHKFGSRKKPDGTYEYKQKNKFPDYQTYQNPPSYGSRRGILDPKSTSQSEPYFDTISRKQFTGINRPEKIPPKVKKKLDTLDNLQGNMDFQVQKTQQIKTGSKKPLEYRRSSGAKGTETTDKFMGSTGADAQQGYGKFKGGEYNPKISGKGIGDYQGKIAGYYGKGNKARRRAGGKVKEAEFPGIGRENYRSTTSGLLPSVGGDIRIKPGSKVGRTVNIDRSKEKSRKIREFIKQNQKRMANIKKGKGPLGISEK